MVHKHLLSATFGALAIAATVTASPAWAQNPPATQTAPEAQAPSPPPPTIAPAPLPQLAPPPATTAPTASEPQTAYVTANVNLRGGPGTDMPIITTIPAGSAVHVGSCTLEWCAVEWNGRDGYAIARNLSAKKPQPVRRYAVRPYYQPAPPLVYGPSVYYPPRPYYRPYYYGPRYYYGRSWGRRYRW
jgi:uncharacterized protein YraI